MMQAAAIADRPAASHEFVAGLALAGAQLVADASGALYWPREGMLVVSDLHLDKGAAFAGRGILLPPYDTAATLARLEKVIEVYAPRMVVSLGDSFHERETARRLDARFVAWLARLMRGRDWVWIVGNHDPEPPAGLGGDHADSLAVGPLSLRHEPGSGAQAGEIAGHFHPAARLRWRGRALRRRCFATDGARLVMPAFGAYAGGLNILDSAFAPLFPGSRPQAFMLGAKGTYRIAGADLVPD